MARNKRGKMALYEAMSKARQSPGFGRTLERMRAERSQHEPEAEPEAEEAVATEPVAAEPVPEPVIKWTRKPRMVQLNGGRVEFSMPYQLAITLGLGLVFVVLVVFRAGQLYYPRQEGSVEAGVKAGVNQERLPRQDSSVSRQANTPIVTRNPPQETVKPEKPEPPRSKGSNVIVIVEYKRRDDLVPVQKHFVDNGISTEIVAEGGRYFLQSRDRYDNLSAPGSDGYEALRKIREVGAKYRGKAPEGLETFAPNFFKDAYGRKVD